MHFMNSTAIEIIWILPNLSLWNRRPNEERVKLRFLSRFARICFRSKWVMKILLSIKVLNRISENTIRAYWKNVSQSSKVIDMLTIFCVLNRNCNWSIWRSSSSLWMIALFSRSAPCDSFGSCSHSTPGFVL